MDAVDGLVYDEAAGEEIFGLARNMPFDEDDDDVEEEEDDEEESVIVDV